LLYLCKKIIFLESDPDNYMTYFKRATVLLALGKSKTALSDLTKVVELRPDFIRVNYYNYIFNLLKKQILV